MNFACLNASNMTRIFSLSALKNLGQHSGPHLKLFDIRVLQKTDVYLFNISSLISNLYARLPYSSSCCTLTKKRISCFSTQMILSTFKTSDFIFNLVNFRQFLLHFRHFWSILSHIFSNSNFRSILRQFFRSISNSLWVYFLSIFVRFQDHFWPILIYFHAILDLVFTNFAWFVFRNSILYQKIFHFKAIFGQFANKQRKNCPRQARKSVEIIGRRQSAEK